MSELFVQVERSLELGWRQDADLTIDENYRILQFTPPGSPASIQFGTGLTALPLATDDPPVTGGSFRFLTSSRCIRRAGADVRTGRSTVRVTRRAGQSVVLAWPERRVRGAREGNRRSTRWIASTSSPTAHAKS